MEVDNKPQPMAGFNVGVRTPSPSKTENIVEMMGSPERGSVEGSPFPPLTPLSETRRERRSTESRRSAANSRLVFFPVELEVDKMKDWEEQNNNNINTNVDNNNEKENKSGTLIRVNNTDVAVFKYGDQIIATSDRCPHAGGPLHLGDIEVLPDKSLCVRCPWHKWAFKVSGGRRPGERFRRNLFQDVPDDGTMKDCVGSCVFPPNRGERTLQVFPTQLDRRRKTLKIGFESFDNATLKEETF